MSIRYIQHDFLSSANTNNLLILIKYMLVSHTMHLTILKRFGQTLGCILFMCVMFKFLFEYFIRILFASDISCKAQIGLGLIIIHGHDIVIGANVSFGKNTKIFNEVTFGDKVTSVGNQSTVGNHCTFCTGAKILVPLRIVDNVTNGANSVLITDCFDNFVVAGISAKIIKYNKL